MRKDAADARAKAAKLLAYAEALEAAADAQEGLQARNGYDTVRAMNATVARGPHRGTPATKGRPMTDAAKTLGLVTLQALADALRMNYTTVRSINKRGHVPADVQAKIDALAEKKRAD